MSVYGLPTEITFSDGSSAPIRNRGDYRVVLDCFEVLNDNELDKEERSLVSLIIFLEDMETIDDLTSLYDINEALTQMYHFFNCGQTYFDEIGKPKLMDWKSDSTLIFSAINNVAGREVRADEYLHWWTFNGLYMSIGESAFATVVGIRNKIIKGKKLEKYEQEFKRDNPHYFVWDSESRSKKEADELAKQLWNSDT